MNFKFWLLQKKLFYQRLKTVSRIPCGLAKTLIGSFLFIGTLFIARPFGIIPEGYVFSFEADPILNLSEHNITAALNNSKSQINDPHAPVASLEVAVTARKITEEEAIELIFYGIALLVPILSAIINVLNRLITPILTIINQQCHLLSVPIISQLHRSQIMTNLISFYFQFAGWTKSPLLRSSLLAKFRRPCRCHHRPLLF